MTENFKKKRKQSNAEKPILPKPLEFDEAVSDLLKVKPEVKKTKSNTKKVSADNKLYSA
jgi:hypothetical protein